MAIDSEADHQEIDMEHSTGNMIILFDSTLDPELLPGELHVRRTVYLIGSRFCSLVC